MKRLTNKTLAKCFETHTYVEGDVYDMSQPQPSFEEIYSKLSKYEDIKEELGIDLITLYKALTDTVYANYNDKIIEVTVDGIDRKYIWFYAREYPEKYKNFYTVPKSKRIKVCYELKNYGKTWALTKEELEKC